MFGLGSLLKKGAGVERQYGPVSVHGYPLRCQVCHHDQFWEHSVQLHTPTATFFNVEFMNRVANCAVCGHCGYVHFFLPTSMAPSPADESEFEEQA